MSFDQFGLREEILQKLEDLKFQSPTPVQAKCIPKIMKGRDLIGLSQAGTGKTLAFGLPLIEKYSDESGIQALILAPTRELARQIASDLAKVSPLGKRQYACLVGGESFQKQLDKVVLEPNFIVGTPGRVLDFLKSGQLQLKGISSLVLDEIDRILDMGFRNEVNQILKFLPKKFQALLFSATFDHEVENLALQLLDQPVKIQIGNIQKPVVKLVHELCKLADEDKVHYLYYLIKQYHMDNPWIVFTRTQVEAAALHQFISQFSSHAILLHGAMLPRERQSAMGDFLKRDNGILICTDIAARGIHKDEVELVISFRFPDDPENFLHRLGRTGRAGREGKAITLLSPSDQNRWLHIQDRVQIPFEIKSPTLPALPQIKVPSELLSNTDRFRREKKGSVKVFATGKKGKVKSNSKKNQPRKKPRKGKS